MVGHWQQFASWGRSQRRWSPNTSAQYVRRCKAADAWLRSEGHAGLMRARPEQMRAWWETQPDTPQSRNQARKAVVAFGCWLVATGRRKANPSEDLPTWTMPRGVPRPLDPDEADRVRELVRRTTSPAATAVTLMLYCGLRISEAAGLAWRDYDGEWLRVTGKGGHTRRVPAPQEVQRVLRRWRLACASEVWVLPGMYGPVSVGWLRTQVVELTGHAGHVYRHTAATELLSRCGDLRLVQEYLGHVNPGVTAGYAQVRPGRLADAVALMYGT